MTSLAQVTALVDAYANRDHVRFRAVTLQIAAHVSSRSERGADQLRRLVERQQAVTLVPLPSATGLLSVPYDLATLDDMVLAPEVRASLDRVVLEHARRDDLGTRGLRPARKLLFTGPPGVGKTMAAGALSRAVGLPMSVRSEISNLPTWPATGSVTFSQGSELGLALCATADGPTTSTCGVGAVRASRSRRRDVVAALPTSVTSGPSGSGSSPPVDLLWSLESRLRARTALLGSTLFSLTWKERTTPSGRSISALRGSVRRTSDSGSTSWPSPVREDAKSSARHGYMIEGNPGTTLLAAARLTADHPSAYPTPQAHDARPPKTPEQIEAMRERAPRRSSGGAPGIANLNEVVLTMVPAPYPTPNASCSTRGGHISHMDGRRSNLMDTVKLMEPTDAPPASWATPVATELGNTVENYLAMKRNMRSGPRMAITHPSLQAQLTAPVIALSSSMIPPGEDLSEGTGPMASSGSTAGRRRGTKTGASGQLNPAHSRWLMALPKAWDELAPRDSVATATRSSSRKPRSSSKR